MLFLIPCGIVHDCKEFEEKQYTAFSLSAVTGLSIVYSLVSSNKRKEEAMQLLLEVF